MGEAAWSLAYHILYSASIFGELNFNKYKRH